MERPPGLPALRREGLRLVQARPLNGTSLKARTGTTSQRHVWKCRACCKQFSVLTGTIFPGFMLHRIRVAMQREPLADLLRGAVMSDRTWIGGAPANRQRDDRREQVR